MMMIHQIPQRRKTRLEALFSAIAEAVFGYLLQESGLAGRSDKPQLCRVIVYVAKTGRAETEKYEALCKPLPYARCRCHRAE